jgi:hypothetical protein
MLWEHPSGRDAIQVLWCGTMYVPNLEEAYADILAGTMRSGTELVMAPTSSVRSESLLHQIIVAIFVYLLCTLIQPHVLRFTQDMSVPKALMGWIMETESSQLASSTASDT